MITFIAILVSCIISGVIGMAIGDLAQKHNGKLGFLLGLLLGPVGWIIAAVIPADADAPQAKSQAGAGMDSTKIILAAIGVCTLILGAFVLFVSRLG